eukprot:jgi/Mesvir1/5179/Mv15314-RA.1
MVSCVQFLESQQLKYPELASWYGQLGELYSRKLWHQLTLKLEEFVALAVFQTGDALIHLYHEFIADFALKINFLKLAQIAVVTSRQYKNPDDAHRFLSTVVDKLSGEKSSRVAEPLLYIRMQMASIKLNSGDVAACKAAMEEGNAALENLTDLDPSVHACVHWVTSQYHKSQQNFAEFYKSALQYLSYVSVDSLLEASRQSLAADLALSALLGEGVYSFGELVAHPIVKSLETGGAGWLLELLRVFNDGDLEGFDRACVTYAAQLNAQPALVAQERHLREKITILCLLELVSSRPSSERTIPLSAIAERARLPADGVEFLLMKALAAKLIDGKIDQVAGHVRVTWVQPRVVGLPQVSVLKDRLDNWISKVESTLSVVESQTPELMAS